MWRAKATLASVASAATEHHHRSRDERQRCGFGDSAQPRVGREQYVSAPFLSEMLRNETPPGITEFSCHPGYITDDYRGIYSHEREAEIQTLTDPQIKHVIQAEGIELISYAQIPALRPQD